MKYLGLTLAWAALPIALFGQTRSIDETTGTVSLEVPAQTGFYVVEEMLPPGVVPFEISDNGHFESTTATIRWGLFEDEAVNLNYRMASASVVIDSVTGEIVDQDSFTAFTGDTQVSLSEGNYEGWVLSNLPDATLGSFLTLRSANPDEDAWRNDIEYSLTLDPLRYDQPSLLVKRLGPNQGIELSAKIRAGLDPSEYKIDWIRLGDGEDPFAPGLAMPSSLQADNGDPDSVQLISIVNPVDTDFFQLRVIVSGE